VNFSVKKDNKLCAKIKEMARGGEKDFPAFATERGEIHGKSGKSYKPRKEGGAPVMDEKMEKTVLVRLIKNEGKREKGERKLKGGNPPKGARNAFERIQGN